MGAGAASVFALEELYTIIDKLPRRDLAYALSEPVTIYYAFGRIRRSLEEVSAPMDTESPLISRLDSQSAAS